MNNPSWSFRLAHFTAMRRLTMDVWKYKETAEGGLALQISVNVAEG